MENIGPEAERQRVENLTSYEIMGTHPEMTFDQFTFIASTICQTPVALLSFIDDKRQWFKSTHGLDISELPRFLTACSQTILENEAYVVEDSLKDASPFADFMNKEGFRFYAGVPITSPEGLQMGVLCVIDYRPRTISREQIRTLKVLSSQIVEILNIRKHYQDTLQYLKEKNGESLKSEKHIQDIAHRSAMKATAELSSGLSYRIKPLVMSMMNDFSDNPWTQQALVKTNGRLIMDMLDSLERFVEAEKEKTMRPVNLNFLLNSVLNHLDWKLKKHGAIFHSRIDKDVMGVGNSSQLAQAFFILLENAIDAVEKSPDKIITVGLVSKNHEAILTAEDHGEGVPESVRPFIFLPFFTTKSSDHLGIGLSLADALIRRHSGEISLKKSGKPTVFELRLPLP